MLFALFGLGFGELAILGACCGVMSVGVIIAVVLMLFTGKRSADPDDSKRNRDAKARREQADYDDADENPADKDTGFKGEKSRDKDAPGPADGE